MLACKITAQIAVLLEGIFSSSFGMRKFAGLGRAVNLNFMLFGQCLKFGESWNPSNGMSDGEWCGHGFKNVG